MTELVPRRPRRHRGLFWAAVLLALAVTIGGGVVAYTSYASTSGPDGAVKGYFAALQRGDASAALAFGDIPAGPRTLLTRSVLRQQLRLAPIHDVHIVSVDRTGNTARVAVQYVLNFGGPNQRVSDTAVVVKRKGSWRLAASAVAVRLNFTQASDRATIAGTAVSADPVLIFPGAIPVRFDTPYLQLDQDSRTVPLNSPDQADLTVTVTELGRDAVTTELHKQLPACLAGAPTAAPNCPRPSLRAVPGSLHATVLGAITPLITVTNGASGTIDVMDQVTVTGTYQLLDFNDIAVTKTGSVTVPVHATTIASPPIRLVWVDDAS